MSHLNPFAPRIEYRRLEPGVALPVDVLLAVEFGVATTPAASRSVRVQLEPLSGTGFAEVWRGNGAVNSGLDGDIRFAADDHHLAGVIEVDERAHGGLRAATAHAYRLVTAFQARSPYTHMLRVWNYLDAINEGEGDAERYRQFCVGRIEGVGGSRHDRFPAATAIGRGDGVRVLQVYWLGGRVPGIPIENPRQLAAYHYPRQYGPAKPTFSRAMQVAPGLLMVSGTASIVGHASRHEGDAQRQLAEIFSNLDSLLLRAHAHDPALPLRFGRGTLIKAYLREREALPFVERELRARLPADTPFVVLSGDICRSDLLVELDCLHAAD
ncbi:MAG: pteridine-dependent deoxygenase [Pseudomonadota bacterium]